MSNNVFKLKSGFHPAGDQPKAIKQLADGIKKGLKHQTLLGVTGSGKTFTIANVIAKIQKPTLVICHNKTLAAQLCQEYRNFFPDNAVEYFISYYDYYQPEAYKPQSDTYIEKEALINEEIERLRHKTTQSLISRKDVIVVASVSCIYNIGPKESYGKNVMHLKKGKVISRQDLIGNLINMQYTRTNSDLKKAAFRMRGEILEIMPASEEKIYRLEFKNQKLADISEMNFVARENEAPPTGVGGDHWHQRLSANRVGGLLVRDKPLQEISIYPAKHFIGEAPSREKAVAQIKKELKDRIKFFKSRGKLLEVERLRRRVNFDMEMIQEIGFCSGIENYSRFFDGRKPDEPPQTLLSYFPQKNGFARIETPINAENIRVNQRKYPRQSALEVADFLTIIDESHATIPQIRGMYEGDRSRKETLVKYGFRLPSALDNRPLTFKEFEQRINQTIYTSATPGEYELKKSQKIAEQIIRPTGLVDPGLIIRPITRIDADQYADKHGNIRENPRVNPCLAGRQARKSVSIYKSQVEDLIERVLGRVKQKERVLVTTLTKKMAEALCDYLNEKQIKTRYLHSDVKSLDRIRILTDFRKGAFDVLVGVNLLREGLDLPEVSLVAILDADKEGFLRSETSLIQTIGRAARNIRGEVVLYADIITGSLKKTIKETERRRKLQMAYNKKHKITPQTIKKAIQDILKTTEKPKDIKKILEMDMKADGRPIEEIIKEKEAQMKTSAKNLEFELAALLRNEIKILHKKFKSQTQDFLSAKSLPLTYFK